MREFPHVLFPYNGQYFTFDGFVEQLVKAIAEAKVYETNTARRASTKVQKELLKAVAERLKQSGE